MDQAALFSPAQDAVSFYVEQHGQRSFVEPVEPNYAPYARKELKIIRECHLYETDSRTARKLERRKARGVLRQRLAKCHRWMKYKNAKYTGRLQLWMFNEEVGVPVPERTVASPLQSLPSVEDFRSAAHANAQAITA